MKHFLYFITLSILFAGGLSTSCKDEAPDESSPNWSGEDLILSSIEAETIESMRDEMGLTWEDIRFDPSDYGANQRYTEDPFITGLVLASQADPRQVPNLAQTTIDEVTAAYDGQETTSEWIRILAERQTAGSMEYSSDPLNLPQPAATEPLLSALDTLYESENWNTISYGLDSWETNRPLVADSINSLPEEFQNLVATYLLIGPEVVNKFEMAIEDFSTTDMNGLYTSLDQLHTGIQEFNFDGTIYPSATNIEMHQIFQAAQRWASVAERLAEYLQTNPTLPEMEINFRTPFGRFYLNTLNQDSTYDDDTDYHTHYLFIDSQGNDEYNIPVGATTRPWHMASTFIDAAGNDTYFTEQAGSTGYGKLGVGLAFELAGDDIYRNPFYSVGYGSFGVGGVVDYAGNDTYEGELRVQGAGYVGLGFLADLAGGDTYYLYSQGQGLGSSAGAGMLFDASGNDDYQAELSDKRDLYPGRGTTLATIAQGMGHGRSYHGGRTTIAGGTGLLIDLAGDDRYSSGDVGMAFGYYYGFGMIYDRAGDDYYDSISYGQSSVAHYGVAVLIDETGNDTHYSPNFNSIGMSHDLGVSWFLQLAGDDTYIAGSNSLGNTINQSFTFFIDRAGNDSYEATRLNSCVFGCSTYGQNDSKGNRDDMYNAGFFLEMAGNDSYSFADYDGESYSVSQYEADTGVTLGNGMSWITPPRGTTEDETHLAEKIKGAGRDLE